MGRLSIIKNMALQVMQRFLLLMSCLIFMMKKKPMKKIIVAITLTLLLCLSVGKPLNAQYLDLTRSSPADFSLVGYENLKWDNGSTINVYFLDKGENDIQKKVTEYAVEWTKYANLAFKFYDASKYKEHELPDSAHIRITFYGDGYSSAIGKNSLNRQRNPEDSMCLNRLWELEEDQIRRKVLHEFGHAIGLTHEHQSPAAGIKWDKDAVYKDHCVKGYENVDSECPEWECSNPWSKEDVDHNILIPLEKGEKINHSKFDPDSIMIYEIPECWTTDGFSVAGNTTLSDMDKEEIAKWYPDKIQDFIPEERYTANLFSLACGITEDWVGADECKLVISVDGGKGKVFRQDMNDGDVWPLNLKYTFKKNLSIELYDEEEHVDDNYLGGFEIPGKNFSGFLYFLEDDARYSLYLSIEEFVPIVPEPEVVLRAYDGANPTTDSSVRQIQSYVNTIWVEGLISLDAETYFPGPGNILDFEGKSIILNTTPGTTVNVVPEYGNTLIIKNSGSGTARIEPGANGKIIIGQ